MASDDWIQYVVDGHDGAGEASSRARELERVVRLLSDSFDVSTVAQPITESVLPLLRARSSMTWLRPSDGSLALVATAGREREDVNGKLRPLDVGLAGRAVTERRTLGAADALDALAVRCAEPLGHDVASAGEYAVLAVPLIVRGDAIGAIVIEYAEPRGFTPAEIDLVEAFGEGITPVLRNVQLFARAQAALAETQAANRAKDEFLGLVAHEFRNLLLPIMLSADLLLELRPSVGPVQRRAGIVRRQALHLSRLVDELLDASRSARGTIDLQRTPVSLDAAVAEAVEATRPLVNVGGLTVSVLVPPATVWLDADPLRLEQIILNVINNAIKYTPAGGRIDITVAIESGEAVLRVRDTGIGIVSDVLPRVFDLFFRSDRAQAHSQNGLGVGLSLVRQLVELHGGRVAAHSDGCDRGTELTAWFPLGASDERVGSSNGAVLQRKLA